MAVNQLLKCSGCKLKKPAKDFYKNKSRKSGLFSRCKKCMDITTNRYRKNHFSEYQEYQHKRNIKRYGITLEEYDELFEEQNGCCAICRKINKDGRRLFVDHNHLTGKVRGLLCYYCNSGIGNFEENVLLLKSVIKYLEE